MRPKTKIRSLRSKRKIELITELLYELYISALTNSPPGEAHRYYRLSIQGSLDYFLDGILRKNKYGLVAFQVRCDESNHSKEDVDNEIFNVDVTVSIEYPQGRILEWARWNNKSPDIQYCK